MTKGEFLAGYLRLQQRYGTKPYTEQVGELIYEEVRQLDMKWWDTVITKLMANNRFAPLLPEIREESSKEKYKTKKYQQTHTEQFPSMFCQEEVIELIQTVGKAGKGLINSVEAKEYSDMVTEMLKENTLFKPNCDLCNDEGIRMVEVTGALPYVYKCKCKSGRNRREDYPSA